VGQQQLLFILLGILVVGVAVFVGINYFRANAIEAKRNNVTNELVNLASLAQQFFLKPSALGGGSRSFVGWSIPPSLVITANGNYSIETINKTNVIILGTGNEVVTNNDSIKVKIDINASSYQTQVIN
jgi:hypothetical protein